MWIPFCVGVLAGGSIAWATFTTTSGKRHKAQMASWEQKSQDQQLQITHQQQQISSLRQFSHPRSPQPPSPPIPKPSPRSVQVEPVQVPPPPIDTTALEAFLSSRNITINRIPDNLPNPALDPIAFYMGSKYDQIFPFYKRVKSTMNEGKKFGLNIKSYPSESQSSMCQLADSLYKIAYLQHYFYLKSPQYMIQAQINRIPDVINFLSGQWLERYIREVIIHAIQDYPDPELQQNYSYLMNPHLTLANGDAFEIDLLFKIADKIFWIETKTGKYQDHITKYSNLAGSFGISRQHIYVVLGDADPQIASHLSQLFNLQVVTVQAFPERFKADLDQALGSQAQT